MEAEYQACGAVARESLSLLKMSRDLAQLSLDFPLCLTRAWLAWVCLMLGNELMHCCHVQGECCVVYVRAWWISYMCMRACN
jgi:hypothetical protein